MSSTGFNVRVYGLCIIEGKVLLTNEKIGDFNFTKFPGGGLQFGEGTKECLVREFKEELKLEINILSHFYTTDFFQASSFNKKDQIISVYYLVEPKSTFKGWNKTLSEDIKLQSIFWKNIQLLDANELTFPIDQQVVRLYQQGLA